MKAGQARYFLVYCLSFMGTSLGSYNVSVVVLGFMASSYNMPTEYNFFKYSYLGAALPLALSDSKNSSMLSSVFNKYDITYVMQPSECNQKISLTGLVALQQQWRVAGVIGPDCSSALMSAGLLASAWNIPLIGFVSQSTELSDKSIYNTVIRSNPSYGLFSNPLRGLCSRYNWTTVGLLTADPLGIFSFILQALSPQLKAHNITNHQESFSNTSYTMLKVALQRLSNMSRGMFYDTLYYKHKYNYTGYVQQINEQYIIDIPYIGYVYETLQ